MPLIIERPNPWNILSGVGSDLQAIRRQEEEERERERQERRKLAMVGGGLALGALGGLALAPAAVASASGAVPGIAAGTALTAAGTPAAAGALTYGLTGAAIGAQAGQQFAGGDYAGAIGTVAGGVNQGIQARQESALYGAPLSREERSALAQQAVRLGTTLSSMEASARQGGGTVPQQLQALRLQSGNVEELNQLARDMNLPVTGSQLASLPASERQQYIQQSLAGQQQVAQTQAFEMARQTQLGRLQAETDQAVQMGQMEFVPDQAEIQAVNERLNAIGSLVGDYMQTNGAAGRPLAEFDREVDQLHERLRLAQRGKPQQKPPKFRIVPGTNTSEAQVGDIFPDVGFAVEPTDKGGVNFKTFNPRVKLPQTPDESRQHIINRGIPASMADQYYVGENGEPKPLKENQTAAEKLQSDIILAGIKSAAEGKREASEIPALIRAASNVTKIAPFDEAVAAKLGQLGTGTIGPQDYVTLRKQALALYPGLDADPGLSDLRGQIAAIGAEAAQNVAAAQAAQLAAQQTVAPPPAGSAAAAEAPTPSNNGNTNDNTSIDINVELEKTRLDNISAGIDGMVTILGPRGESRTVLKKFLTEQEVQKLMAEGWRIPGLEP